jgi:hypothetical protein
MPRNRVNGGIVGSVNTTTSSVASGLWSMAEYTSLIGAGNIWPGLIAIAKATGGVITATVGGVYHTFTSTGSFIPSSNITNAQVLLVGAGSSGANNNFPGTGGAAGAVILSTGQSFNSGTTYTITIGTGGTAPTSINTNGGSGTATTVTGTGFATLTANPGTFGGVFIGTSGSGFTSTNGSGGAGAAANGGTTTGGNGSTVGDTITKAIAAAGGTVYGDLQGGVYYYGGGGGSGNNGVGGFGGGGHGTTASGSAAGGTLPNANSGSGGGGGSNIAPGGSTNGANGLVIITYT